MLAIPLILGLLIAFLLTLLLWGAWRSRRNSLGNDDNILIVSLLAVAFCAAGAFVAYAFLGEMVFSR